MSYLAFQLIPQYLAHKVARLSNRKLLLLQVDLFFARCRQGIYICGGLSVSSTCNAYEKPFDLVVSTATLFYSKFIDGAKGGHIGGDDAYILFQTVQVQVSWFDEKIFE